MRTKAWGYLGLALLAAMGFLALRAQKPVAFFVLRDVEAPEAFRVDLVLGSGADHVEAVALTRDQRRLAMDLLKDRDPEKLARFAKDLGDFHAGVGLPGTEGAWPSFWGAAPVSAVPDAEFDDLTGADRAFLSMGTRPSPPAPGLAPIAEKPTPTEPKNLPTPMATAPSAAALLVEIQNGCGITGAADWVARRVKDAGVQVTSVDATSGQIRGTRNGIDVAVGVVRQADGRTRVQFDAKGSKEQDPGLPTRFLEAYDRRMGR